jgi:OFA family oxalate/formate antiporter-like MFS transporter
MGEWDLKPAEAGFMVSVTLFASSFGGILFGTIADRIGRKRALVVMFTGMAATLAVWAASSGFWLLAGFAFGYGVFYGGFVAVLPALVMDYFGSRHISGIIGALYTSVAFGTLVGPSAAGFAFDLRHSYALPIAASIAANLIAAAIVSAIDGPAAYLGSRSVAAAAAAAEASTPAATRRRSIIASRA